MSASADVPELSVVMPCLDEERTVGRCVASARAFFARRGVAGEVVVADNGSRDRSVEVAREAGATVVRVERRGYGAALKAAIAAARAPFVVMADSDATYDTGALDGFLDRLRAGDEFVMGNRFAGGIAPGAMPFLHRVVGNPALTALARLFFGTRFGDVYCGIRGFRRDTVLRLGIQSDGMEFALEMIVRATLAGVRCSEVPATLVTGAAGRQPHLRTWRDGGRSLRLYLLCAPEWLFRYPGALLVVAGFCLGLAITFDFARFAGVHLDVHTLVYCAMAILVGMQAVYFAIFCRLAGLRAGLLPPEAAHDAMLASFKVARGLVLAAVLAALGLAGTVAAVELWHATGFGELDSSRMLRLVIPSATAIALAVQLMFACFYASVLKQTLPRAGRAGG